MHRSVGLILHQENIALLEAGLKKASFLKAMWSLNMSPAMGMMILPWSLNVRLLARVKGASGQ
jgi:hypothetical protein